MTVVATGTKVVTTADGGAELTATTLVTTTDEAPLVRGQLVTVLPQE